MGNEGVVCHGCKLILICILRRRSGKPAHSRDSNRSTVQDLSLHRPSSFNNNSADPSQLTHSSNPQFVRNNQHVVCSAESPRKALPDLISRTVGCITVVEALPHRGSRPASSQAAPLPQEIKTFFKCGEELTTGFPNWVAGHARLLK